MTLTQANRWLTIESPLGQDVLLPIEISGREALSQPFEYRVVCISTRQTITPEEILGQSITVHIGHLSEERLVNGVVRAFRPGGIWARDLRVYEFEIVPTLWLLSLSSDLRIFQEKTAMEVIEQVLGDAGISDFEKRLSGTPAKRDYCVQYRETTLDFVTRLLAEEGIFYSFRHETARHVIRFADSPSAYDDLQPKTVEYRPGEGAKGITGWEPAHAQGTGKWTLRDYDFTRTMRLDSTQSTNKQPSKLDYEVYDYPGRFVDKSVGDVFARRRIEGAELGHTTAEGRSRLPALRPGLCFTLSKHPSPDQTGKDYVITEVTHSATDHTHMSGEGDTGTSYENSFTCMPAATVFRPPDPAPRPRVLGPHTAVVVGPSGEEIYTDEYGRIKVQFHWDRVGASDENSSCWVRVAQALAGPGWGAVMTPRIDMEVVVEFLEGDPDRPLVTGCVYNSRNMPPYTLPDNKTQSGFKSRSTKQGSADDFNELRFEDKKGSEEVYFHAQKDFKRVVENDDTTEIGRDQTVTIERDQATEIKGKETRKITGNQTVTVKTGNQSTTVETGNQSTTVETGNRTTKTSMGSDKTEALQEISFTCGGSTIKMTPAEIKISSPSIKIQATGALEATAGAKADIKAGGIMTIMGATVKIN